MVEKYAARFEKLKSIPICTTHEGERMHFFCVTCDATVCRDCLVIKHPRTEHEIQELKDITKLRKEEMRKRLEHVNDEMQKVEKDIRRLGEVEIQIRAAQKQAEGEIDAHVKQLCAQIETIGKELKSQVHKISQRHLKKVQEEKNCTKDRGKRLQNVCAATQNIIDTAANHIYMKQHSSLVTKMERLCDAQYEILASDLVVCIHFKPGADPVSPAWFGSVDENNHEVHELTLVAEFGTFKKARSVAVTQSGLFAVVDSKAEEVVVYHYDIGEYKRQFCLGDTSSNPEGKLIKPLKVAVTSDDKFLVIDDGHVKRFSSTGAYEQTLSIIGDRITTTPDDMIVVTNSRKGHIKVYKPNGELLKTHAIDSKNVADIASNGKQIAYTTGSEGNACVIDIESGHKLWTLDITWPLGICFVPKSDDILVAGHATKRGQNMMRQYCSTSGHLILSPPSRLSRATRLSGLWNPYAMTITRDGTLLAVADLKTVKLYRLD